MGVSQELLYEFRTVQVVLGFPRVFCTAVRVNRRRERQFLLRWINGLHNQTVQMTGSATSHSLSEALPLQEVLHSPIRDSAANYFFNHKLLDNCSLLSLPLFGSLLLSHSATIENKRMNEGQGNHKNREFISFRAKKKNKLNTVESGTFTFISLLLGFFFPAEHGSGDYSAVPFIQWSAHLLQRSTCCFCRVIVLLQSKKSNMLVSPWASFTHSLVTSTFSRQQPETWVNRSVPRWCIRRCNEQYARTLSVFT